MLTTEQETKIEAQFEAAKKIAKTLAPLTVRGRRRILNYLSDLVSDPDQDFGLAEARILEQVEQTLRDL